MRVGPNLLRLVSLKEEIRIQTLAEGRPGEDTKRKWPFTSQGGTNPADSGLRLAASRAVRKEVSAVEDTQAVVFCYGSPSKLKGLPKKYILFIPFLQVENSAFAISFPIAGVHHTRRNYVISLDIHLNTDLYNSRLN